MQKFYITHTTPPCDPMCCPPSPRRWRMCLHPLHPLVTMLREVGGRRSTWCSHFVVAVVLHSHQLPLPYATGVDRHHKRSWWHMRDDGQGVGECVESWLLPVSGANDAACSSPEIDGWEVGWRHRGVGMQWIASEHARERPVHG